MTNKIAIFLIFGLVIFKITAVYFSSFTLYGDEAQYWLWSQKPDFGYFSKPPLLAWFLFFYTSVFGDSFFSLKLFPVIIYFFIVLGIYKLSLGLSLSKKNSVLCAVSFFIIPAVSLSSFLISTDLLLLLFWTLSMIKLLEIRKSGSNLSFFLLGIFLGLAFLAKYAAIYFVISFVFLLIIDKKTSIVFKNNLPGFFILIFTIFFILFPNIYWNLNNGWVTLSHTSDNANLENLNINLYEPLKFILAQILMLGPVLFFSFVLLFKGFNLNFENKFLLVFSIPIIIIVLVESFLVRANANWAAPALISIFVLLFKFVSEKNLILIKFNFVFNYFIVIFLFGSILISSNHSVFDRIRGIDVFVEKISKIVKDEDLVVSDRIIFSNVSYEFKDKKNNLYMPYKKGMPITNHFQLTSAFNNNREKGFFLIGELSDISYLSKEYQGLLIDEFIVPFNSTVLKLYEISFK